MCIEVKDDASVIVRAPLHAAQQAVDRFVRDKAPWIVRHLARLSAQPVRQFARGESFPYLGREYSLVVESNGGWPHVQLEGDKLVACVTGDTSPGSPALKAALLSWYLDQAASVMSARVDALVRQTGLTPSRVRIRAQTRRWGSCSLKASVNLNWRLIMAPQAVLDYVIVHELCHLKRHDHSRQFWDLVASFVPDYRAHRKWLRENGARLKL